MERDNLSLLIYKGDFDKRELNNIVVLCNFWLEKQQ